MWQARACTVVLLLAPVFAELPNGWKACSRKAADYEKCLIGEISNAAKSLKNGDKKLGVLPLEPLRLDLVKIPRHDGPVSIEVEFKNVDIGGVTDIDIKTAKNDWETASGSGYAKRITVSGDYKGDGQVLVLPIKGDGRFNLTFEDMEMTLSIDWKKIDIKGKKYFQMKNFHLDLIPKQFSIQLENLFNGNKELGDNMNKFLNENWQVILDEFKPPLLSALDQVFTQIGNRVMKKIPAADIDIP